MNYLSDTENENNKLALLENLPLPQLLTLCETNKFYNNLCNGFNSERIFETRSRNEFGDDILELKDPNMKWKEFYIRVHKFNRRELTFQIYGPSHTKWLLALFKQNDILELKLLVLKLLKRKSKNLINSLKLDDHAVFYNNFEFLKWLSTKIEINDHIMLEAIHRNRIDMVKWLFNEIVDPLPIDASISLIHDDLEIAEFLSNLDPPVLPDINHIILPRIRDKKKVSDWLQSKGLRRID